MSVEVTTTQPRVEMTPSGPNVLTVGLQGPPGPPGTPGIGFIFTQSTPALIWTINHNLGFIPDAAIFDVGGNKIRAEVTNPSINQTVINFVLPVAGSARLS